MIECNINHKIRKFLIYWCWQRGVMIVYGRYIKTLKGKHIEAECQLCKNNSLRVVALQPIAHLFFIPFYPESKAICLRCDNCGSKYSAIDYLNKAIKPEDLAFKTPIWTFVGTPLVILLITILFITGTPAREELNNFRQNPVAGSYFTADMEFDTGEHKNLYAYAKITKVAGDKVTIRFSKFGYTRSKRMHADIAKNLMDIDSTLKEEVDVSLDAFRTLKILSLEKFRK